MSEIKLSLRQIFNEAVEIVDPKRRGEYLAQACGADTALRRSVEELIEAYNDAGRFLGGAGETGGQAGEKAPDGVTHVSAISEQAGEKIGRYKLLQEIGEGGCGVVFMAEQQEPVLRRVALKVIKLGMDTRSVIARFEAERQALALMDHPNIAHVFDAGTTDAGRPYFVMELVRGVRITDYCDQNHLPTSERLALFTLVCHAIQHAHQKGIIHRDIKPSNILVTMHDGVPVPKVIDFGIAKATSDQRLTDKTLFTAFEQFMGTPAYMSPEQAEMSGLGVDTRSDIYALGVLLYELLTGKPPFDGKELLASGLDAMRRTIREVEPVKPSTRLTQDFEAAGARALQSGTRDPIAEEKLRASSRRLLRDVRGDLDWIVMKALEKDRTRRYDTPNGLAQDIERHLKSEPVEARPPGAAYRLQKAWRRNRVVFAAGTAVAAALVLGLTVSVWQAVRATKAEASARQKAAMALVERNKALDAQKLAGQERDRADQQRTNAERNLYVANINLIQPSWDQNNFRRVAQLIEETAAYPQRGFEWYYWQRQVHLALRTFRGHSASLSAVAFSPDGQRIVTGSHDTTAKIWDAATGKELLTLKGHTNDINAVTFSPDGQRIVTGSSDQTARVWESASGKELFTLRGHSNNVNAVAFSPDGQRIVTGCGDGTAKVWEAASGKELLTLKGHTNSINSVALSPDGQRILTGGWDRTARVWDAASGKELLSLRGHSGMIWSVAFSPDGQRIVTGCWEDKTAKLWETASGKELLTLKGHNGEVLSVAFSPDGQRIATGSWDHTAKVWEAASGRELLTLRGHSDLISSVAFSPDGQRIGTGSYDGTAKVWEASGKEPLTLQGHSSHVSSVAFSPDSQRIVTGSDDHTAKLWETASGKELLTLRGHSDGIPAVAFSPDGRRIATGSFDQTAKVWEAASGKELLTLKGHSDPIQSLAFSPDGQRIVTGSDDHTAKLWEATTAKELLTFKGHSSPVFSVAFSPDSRRIVTGSYDQTASVWDAASGKELLTLRGHNGWIVSAAFSPDGQRIVTGSGDGTAKVWEAASGKQLLTLQGHNGWVHVVAFSPDSRRIVTGGEDQTAKVWEAGSGKELLTLKGHGNEIYAVAFSPDGQRIVTGSYDQTAKVWEAATPTRSAQWQTEERAAAEHLAVLSQERELQGHPEH